MSGGLRSRTSRALKTEVRQRAEQKLGFVWIGSQWMLFEHLRQNLAEMDAAVARYSSEDIDVPMELTENRKLVQTQLDSIVYAVLSLPPELTPKFSYIVWISTVQEAEWRAIALSTPPLWIADLTFFLNWKSHKVEFLDQWLSRGDLRVDVHRLLRRHAFHLGGLHLSLDENEFYSLKEIGPFPLLCSLSLHLDGRPVTHRALQYLILSSGAGGVHLLELPELRELSLTNLSPSDGRAFLVALNRNVNSTFLPRLRTLDMLQASYTVDRAVMAALQSRYTGSAEARLDSLQLVCYHWYGDREWEELGDIDWDALYDLGELGMDIYVGLEIDKRNFLWDCILYAPGRIQISLGSGLFVFTGPLLYRLAEIDATLAQHNSMDVDVPIELMERRETAQAQLDNIVYPILTLPPELTSEIFIHCMEPVLEPEY
ncbi:hypothetical protein C8R43DRAFT_944182 [Mycena crocata]|nr:hypothetical protein C8R43DRAFT_944182 [Mycena crocata]